MRTTLLALAAISTLIASPALAGPPCRTDVGGLCGSDYDGWMQTWRRTNPGKTIQPVSPGGYGLRPNGQQFYPDQGGIYGGRGQVVVTQPQVYGVPQQNYGYPAQGVPQVTQGPVTHGYITHTVANPWTGHRLPNGMFVCDSGPCPPDGARSVGY